MYLVITPTCLVRLLQSLISCNVAWHTIMFSFLAIFHDAHQLSTNQSLIVSPTLHGLSIIIIRIIIQSALPN